MAQVVGNGHFDYVWERKLQTGLRLLRSAADEWAAGRKLGEQNVLAVLLRLFSRRWSPYGVRSERAEEERSLEDWLSLVGSAVNECKRLAKGTSADASGVVRALIAILQPAASYWREGHPERPRTHDVLTAIVSVLFDQRLVPRTARSNLDDGPYGGPGR